MFNWLNRTESITFPLDQMGGEKRAIVLDVPDDIHC